MEDPGPHNLSESSANAGKEVPGCQIETPCVVRLSESEITHIPPALLTNKPKAYEPDTVSLGPFHSGQLHLQKFEQIKHTLFCRRFPYRSVSTFDKKLVDRMTNDQFITMIWQWYYPNTTDPVREGLGKMMALDGIFLLQVLREISPLSEIERSLSFTEISVFADPEVILNLDNNATRPFQLLLQPLRVQEDIMKLENQIPLFALKKIIQWEEETYEAMTKTMHEEKAGIGENKMLQGMVLQDMMLQARTGTNQDLNSILKKAFHRLSPFPDMHADREDLVIFPGESSHLLGFVYRNIIGSSDSADGTQSSEMGKNKNMLPARAVVLDSKGVKFAALKGPFDKIRFDGKTWTFHLPRIEIDNRTDTVMRNLLAFKLFVCQIKPIKCYAELMNQLINTAEDVEVLKKHGIIQHHLGTDQEVADIWNKMGEGLDQKDKYGPIDTAIDEVIKFYGSYRIWYAKSKKKYAEYYDEWIRKYFSRPWRVASLIVGCIFVITSVLQTIFAWEQLRL